MAIGDDTDGERLNEVREHMRRCPDHEMTVGSDNQWHCLTCEDDDHEEQL